MFILANLVLTIAQILDLVLTVFYWIILVRALISWVSPDPFNPLVQFLHQITEPVLEPIRRVLPHTPVDFSPLVAFLLVMAVKSFVVTSLLDLGVRMKY